MVDKSDASYLYQKRGVYYFSKHVPCDVNQHYSRNRIVVCLRTKSSSKATRSCKSILQRLEDYWMSLRLSAMPLPGQHLIQDRPSDYYGSDTPLLSEALAKCLMLKGEGKDKTFVRGANRNIQYVTDQLGDRPIDAYTSADAAALRDKLIENGLSVSSVKRNFSTIRSIINLVITEQGLDCINAFARTYVPDNDRQRRLPIPIDCIRSIQADCHDANDDMRWLVALLSDTGMRLGEALWVASRAIEDESGSDFLFPRYNRGSTSNANSASAAINKWLKLRVPEGCVTHSFRHLMRDRFRAVERPSDIIDAIGGWTTTRVGQRYGLGQPLDVKAKWMNKLIPP